MPQRAVLILLLALAVALVVWLADGDTDRSTTTALDPSTETPSRPAPLGGGALSGRRESMGRQRLDQGTAGEEAEASLTPRDPPGPTLRGRVVDETGAGVPAVRFSASFRATHLRDGSALPPNWTQHPPKSRTLTTDADGAFEMPAPHATGCIVNIGFLEVPQRFQQPKPRRFAFRTEPMELTLSAGASIAGRILPHPDLGRPLSVQVSVHWLEGETRHARSMQTQRAGRPVRVSAPPGTRHAPARGHVDGDGRFAFFGLPPDVRVDLVATPAFEKKAMTFQIKGVAVTSGPARPVFRPEAAGVLHDIEVGRPDVVLTLGTGGAGPLRLTALDEKGRPLAGHGLLIESVEPSTRPERRVTTAGDGSAVVNGLKAGHYRIRPQARSSKPRRLAQTVQLPSEAVRLTFPRAVERRVHGRVLGGGHIAGFRILATGPSLPRPQVALTDADGYFEFLTYADRVNLRAERLGDDRCAHLRDYVPGEASAQLALEPGACIEGRVLDVNGHPLRGEGWVVALNSQASVRVAIPDGGRFRINGLPPGRYTVRASAGRVLEPAEVKNVEAGSVGLELSIPEQR